MAKHYIVEREVDYDREAIELIYRMVNGKTYELLKQDILRRIALPDRNRIEKILNNLSKIEQGMRTYVDISDKRLEFYFKVFAGEDICRASILCQELSYTIRQKTRQETKEQIICYFKRIVEDDSLELVLTKNEFQAHHYEDDTAHSLFERVEGLECEVSTKWDFLYLFNHVEELVNELFDIIEPIAQHLKTFKGELEPLMNECADYWEDFFEKESIQVLISNFYGVSENSYQEFTTYIRPKIMKCDYVLFVDDDETMEDYHIMEIGITFDKNYRAEKYRPTKEQICNGLKLLSDQSKFEILKQINGRKAYGQELAAMLNLTTATISHHMNALMEFGFITIEKKEKKIYYTTNQGAIHDFLTSAMEELVEVTEDN